MTLRHSILLATLALLAGCEGLLGVEPLSGTVDAGVDGDSGTVVDAKPDVDSGTAAPDMDAGCNTWVDGSGGQVPPGAVPDEMWDSGTIIFVCRTSSPTLGLVPGKLLSTWGCYYGDGNVETLSLTYQVLVPEGCPTSWAAAPAGVPPPTALVCGDDLEGGAYYSCRVGDADYLGELGHMGWSTDHACVFSYGGQSYSTGNFDVLTTQ